MKRTMSLATGVYKFIAIVVFFRLLVTATNLVQAVLLAHVLTNFVKKVPISDQVSLLVGIVAAAFARFIAIWIGEVVSQLTSAETKEKLRSRAFDKVAELGPSSVSGEKSSDTRAALVDAIESLEAYYSRYIPSFISVAITPIAVIVIMATYDFMLAAIIAAFIAAALVLPAVWSRLLTKRSGELMESYLKMGAVFLDVLQGLVTLKIFGAATRKRDELARVSQRLVDGWNRLMAVALLKQMIYTLSIVGGIATTVAVASVRTATGNLDVGTLFLAMLLSAEALRVVGVLATSFHASYNAASGAELLHSLLARTPLAPRLQAATSLIPSDANINFENVTFAYSKESPVLSSLSFSIKAGERVAVVGSSGAGKSTLANLLLRFVDPSVGRVTINGRDVREISSMNLRSSIAFVAQDTYLFNGTVRENIALANPRATKEEIIAAAKAAEAHSFIENLPNGYEQLIGEKGLRLSGGQRQRLAIARAFLAKAPILVLDEATASLDAQTESSIQKTLDQLTKKHTTLIIAHRLSTVKNADRILVLEKGKIVEEGKHDDLLSRNGRYSQLLSAQEVG